MRRWRFVFPVIWMGVIWYLSSLQSSEEGHLAGMAIPPLIQNGAHAVFYGVLALAWAFALGPDPMTAQRAVLYCAAYGVVDEAHQYFVPGRTCSLLDLIVDITGAVVVMYVLTRGANYRARLTKPVS